MTPLESFTRQLPTMPLDRIEKVLESLKGSVGGGTKGKVEGAVAIDFRKACEKELARRNMSTHFTPVSKDEFGRVLKKNPLAIPDGFKLAGSMVQTVWNGPDGRVVARKSHDGHVSVYEIAAEKPSEDE